MQTITGLVVMLAFTVLSGGGPAYASGPQGGSAQATRPSKLIPRVVSALEASKFKYGKTREGIWSLSFEADALDGVDVYVQALEDMVVVSAIVKKGTPDRVEALAGLLRASYSANFAKIALDEDGDVVALTELPADFTPESFKSAVNEVAVLADKAAGLLGGPASATTETFPSVAAGRGATLPILRGAFQLTYDPAKWRVKPSNEPGETELQHLGGDAGVKVIAERIEIARDQYVSLVLANAKETAPDVALISQTPHTVNGLNAMIVRYAGTAQGIKFTFLNQLYSDPAGSIQLAAWTGTNLFDEYRRDFLELFAGLTRVR